MANIAQYAIGQHRVQGKSDSYVTSLSSKVAYLYNANENGERLFVDPAVVLTNEAGETDTSAYFSAGKVYHIRLGILKHFNYDITYNIKLYNSFEGITARTSSYQFLRQIHVPKRMGGGEGQVVCLVQPNMDKKAVESLTESGLAEDVSEKTFEKNRYQYGYIWNHNKEEKLMIVNFPILTSHRPINPSELFPASKPLDTKLFEGKILCYIPNNTDEDLSMNEIREYNREYYVFCRISEDYYAWCPCKTITDEDDSELVEDYYNQYNDQFIEATWISDAYIKNSSNQEYQWIDLVFNPMEDTPRYNCICIEKNREFIDYNTSFEDRGRVIIVGANEDSVPDYGKEKQTYYGLRTDLNKESELSEVKNILGGLIEPTNLQKIGVWAHPDASIVVNKEEIKIGSNGYYEVEALREDNFNISWLGVCINDVRDKFLIDYEYHTGNNAAKLNSESQDKYNYIETEDGVYVYNAVTNSYHYVGQNFDDWVDKQNMSRAGYGSMLGLENDVKISG